MILFAKQETVRYSRLEMVHKKLFQNNLQSSQEKDATEYYLYSKVADLSDFLLLEKCTLHHQKLNGDIGYVTKHLTKA